MKVTNNIIEEQPNKFDRETMISSIIRYRERIYNNNTSYIKYIKSAPTPELMAVLSHFQSLFRDVDSAGR